MIGSINTYLFLFACRVTFTISNGLTRIASVTPAPRPANENVFQSRENSVKRQRPAGKKNTPVMLTRGVGLSDPNRKKRLYCSKVKNLTARLGVSTNTGGRMPLYSENTPSDRAILRMQSNTPL